MKIAARYSHLNGWEYIKVHKPTLWDEIEAVIDSIYAEDCKTKISEDKRSRGKMLYSPVEINKCIKKNFDLYHWKEHRTSYWVTEDVQLIEKTMKLSPEEQKKEIEAAGKRAIFSYNQTDFVKDRIAVEVQFGKYAFVAYDLFVKHMAFYMGNVLRRGLL